ncbi:MAG TPA: MOSC domain-containing protein [Candidatus Acidoferrales bacterium]|nr:MOSC domain-containing protein [Candidatus Acidoferrales bacterium]
MADPARRESRFLPPRGADNPDMTVELREIFGRLEDEPIPDLAQFPREILEFTSPLGTYFDAFPFHVLTTATLRAFAACNPTGSFDSRRFRPNVLVETNGGIDGLAEAGWSGRTIRVGEARIKLEVPTVRCVMTTLAQSDLPKDASVLRTIVREAAQNVGAYATVTRAGAIAIGDEVILE